MVASTDPTVHPSFGSAPAGSPRSLPRCTGSGIVAIAIGAVIVLNAVFAFVQEQQAEKAVELLSQYLPPRAKVLRSGRRRAIAAVGCRARRHSDHRGGRPHSCGRPPSAGHRRGRCRDVDRRVGAALPCGPGPTKAAARSSTPPTWCSAGRPALPEKLAGWSSPRACAPSSDASRPCRKASNPARAPSKSRFGASRGSLRSLPSASASRSCRWERSRRVCRSRPRRCSPSACSSATSRRSAADDHARAGRRSARAGAQGRAGQATQCRGDARLGDRDLHRQDGHAHGEPHACRRGVDDRRRPRASRARRRGAHHDDPQLRPLAVALARCTSATIDESDPSSALGDPTEVALLLFARTLGADVTSGTRERELPKRSSTSIRHGSSCRPSTRSATPCGCTPRARRRRSSLAASRS